MANKNLRVNVIVNAKTTQLDRMFKRLNKMQGKLNQQAIAQNKVTNAVNRTNAAHQKSGTLIDKLTTKVHRLANAYLGVMAAKATLNTSDAITSAENKLSYISATNLGSAGYTTDASGAEIYSQATLNATQSSMDKMYTSAQKVRMSYTDMMANVSKSIILANDAFGGNIDNAIRFQEIMSEAYTLSGSSAQEMSGSMYQMIQGLASGILAGDELRSVREGASMAYQLIEKYAQGIYGAEENLKDLASEGKITSDIVVAAILENGEKIDEAFAKTKVTFAQVWTTMKNTAVKSFEPVLQRLNDLLNSPIGRAIVDGIGTAIQVVAGMLSLLFDAIGKIFTFIHDNWGVISKILLTAAAILGGVLLYYLGLNLMTIGAVIAKLITMGAAAVASAIKWVISWAAMCFPMFLVIAIISAIVIALIWMSDSFTDACGIAVGAFMGLISVITNVVVTLLTVVLKIVNVLFQAWDSFANFFANLFNDPIAAIINGFTGLADSVLSILETIAAGIDAIFGSNLSAAVSGWRDGLAGWGDQLVEKYGNGTYVEHAALSDQVDALLSEVSTSLLWDTADAYNTGYGLGEAGGNWISDKVGGIKDNISNALNLGGLPSESLDLGGLPDSVGNIDDNTGSMADSMKLTAEDLAYLKDVANMEWKKEFTTANITVDMTNNNTVSNDFDLNSLAIGLRDLVEEEMFAVANGTYA